MFCPKCGSNQSEGKRFCTACGTNLAAVSQALTGSLPHRNHQAPFIPHPFEIDRQREMAKGVRFAVIGSGFLAWQFFSFVFSSNFSGSPFGWRAIIGIILLAIGIPKIIASRPPGAADSPSPERRPTDSMRERDPHPVFSAPAALHPSVPHTNELETVGITTPSAAVEETRHMPGEIETVGLAAASVTEEETMRLTDSEAQRELSR
jgi:hypothetical protein